MSEEKQEAKLDQLVGSVKEGFGKLTGDKATEVEGAVENLVGKAKEVAADAVDAAKGAIDGLKNSLK